MSVSLAFISTAGIFAVLALILAITSESDRTKVREKLGWVALSIAVISATLGVWVSVI